MIGWQSPPGCSIAAGGIFLSEEITSCQVNKEDVDWIEGIEEVLEISDFSASFVIVEIHKDKTWKGAVLAL